MQLRINRPSLNKILRLAIFIIVVSPLTIPATYATPNDAPISTTPGKVSFTFDDGSLSTFTYALPILNERNLQATTYITSDYVGNEYSLSWEQITKLQNTYGWEIGGHSVTHAELPLLTNKEIEYEIYQNKTDLIEHGISATSFATPFGAYNNQVLTAVARHHMAHRGFWDRDSLNQWPYNRYLLTVQAVLRTTPPSQVFRWIDQAIANDQWLILVFHDIFPEPDPNDDYSYSTDNFTQITDYLVSSGVLITTIATELSSTSPNLISNGDFHQGISAGWTTDSPNRVFADSLEHGCYPNAADSVKFTGSPTQPSHLFSPKFAADSQLTYVVQSFVNSDNLTSGEFGFYMDEYNINDDWISGQWLGMANLDNVAQISFLYQPSSDTVKTASLQYYLTSNSQGEIYLDQANIRIAQNNTPSDQNLVPNPSFEMTENNWAVAWERTTNDFVLDSQQRGSHGTNSIYLTTNSQTAHLFSSKISIDPTVTYAWEQYLKCTTSTGEFGFYLDEYDEADNWISGQWQGRIITNFEGIHSISYTPTSVDVSKIRLQYYVINDSNYDLYLDEVSLTPLD